MKTSSLVLVLALFFACDALAQGANGGSVSGVVVSDSTKHPLEFVNVVVLAQSDSTIVTGTTTDGKGRFHIDSIPNGEYVLTFSLIGYSGAVSSHLTIASPLSALDVGTISLPATAIQLGEVTVTSDKPIFNNAIDRKVYNVQKDILSKTGSASDLLQNIPSVQVDIDGTVSLRGSANVLILLNGKPSPLMGTNRAEVLQQMPGSSIERIEVITNPSAKFKPDGTSGIINIVLKKDAAPGLNGTIGANVGNDGRFNGGVNLNFNPGAFNLFGNYSYREDERNSYTKDARSQPDSMAGGRSQYHEDLRSLSHPISHVGTLGCDYSFDQHNSCGVSGQYRSRVFTRHDKSIKVLADNGGRVANGYDRLRVDPESETEAGMNLFYEHDFRKEDHKLRAEVTVAHSPEMEGNHYTNLYRIPSAAMSQDNMLIKQTEDQRQVTVDYTIPLNEHSTLETGYAGDFNKTDMNNHGEFLDPTRQMFVTDAGTSSRFVYHETIHALYGTYGNGFGPFSFLGGLRVEEAMLKSHLVTSEVTIPNDYVNLYPTLHGAYKLSEHGELQLNYSRRANRPEGEDLNPFPEYVDPRNLRAGNPRLRPELIHSIELGCRLQNGHGNILPSIFYRRKYKGITSVTEALNDSTLLTRKENLSRDQTAGFELVIAGNTGSLFSVNASTDAFYEVIDASNLGFSTNKSTVTWSGTLSCNANPFSATMVQLNSTYRSSRLTPQGKYLPAVVFNLGLRQDLFHDKVSVIVTVSDLFKTLTRKMELATPWLNQTVVTKRDSRIAYAGAAYHFGRRSKKAKDKSLQYDNGL